MTARIRRARLVTAGTALAALAGAFGTSAVDAAAQRDDRDLAVAMATIGIAAGTATELLDSSVADGLGDTFRYAVPGSRPATLEERYVDIVRAGAAEVHWRDDAEPVPCGGRGDALVVCASDTPDLTRPHAVFWLQTAGELPQSPDLTASLAFPVLTDGGAPWVAQGAFQWDTFQGTDRWHDLGIRPDTDWEIVIQRFTGEAVLVEMSDAFAVVLGDAYVLAVPLDELAPLAEGVGGHAAPAGGATVTRVAAPTDSTDRPEPFEHPWRWGASLHFHDGTLGSAPSDTSGIDSHPDTDTDTPRGPEQLHEPTSGPVVAAPPGATTPAADGPAAPSSPDAADGASMPWLAVGATLTLAGGAALAVRRRRAA